MNFEWGLEYENFFMVLDFYYAYFNQFYAINIIDSNSLEHLRILNNEKVCCFNDNDDVWL